MVQKQGEGARLGDKTRHRWGNAMVCVAVTKHQGLWGGTGAGKPSERVG